MIYVIQDQADGRAVALVAADGAREALAKAQRMVSDRPAKITAMPDHAGAWQDRWEPGREAVIL